ncbi:MAG: hypothetical protein HC929_15730 [Leptolyngbyaceae cyanobacterium SM2_5_2]|nr:hypothetical protein [Leptolyngbyaceae cyanobacterium SM2_5_2]
MVDGTFTEKRGRHTYGLDWFDNGKPQRAERGVGRVGGGGGQCDTEYRLCPIGAANQDRPGSLSPGCQQEDTPTVVYLC